VPKVTDGWLYRTWRGCHDPAIEPSTATGSVRHDRRQEGNPMDLSTSRSAARLAVPVLLALLAGGCGGDSGSPTAAPATTTTVAPTTTTVPPLDPKELAWLKGVSAVRTKVENSFQAKGSVSLTRAIVLESSRQLASWGRQLRRLGAPSDRLQPASTLVRKAIQTFDKGAKCYARAAGVISLGGSVVSDRELPMFEEALDCGHAAEGNGANLLYKADAKGDELKAKYG
jgi:hypothetical protein